MARKRGEAFDRFDNHGVVSQRAWLYSEDKDGKRIKPVASGFEGIRCRETRSYAPTPTSETDEERERAERAKRVAEAYESLTAEEHEVLRLQGKVRERRGQRLTIAAGDLVHFQREGYTLIPGSAQMVERQGLPSIECVEVFGWEMVETESLDQAAIAAQLGLSQSQVRSRIRSANKKLKAAK